MRPGIRIQGRSVHKDDWVVLSYEHPDGPLLGLIGRVMQIIEPEDPAGVFSIKVGPYLGTLGQITIDRCQIEVLDVIDGPHLVR